MSPEMFRKLAGLGLSHEQMAGVLEIFDEDAGERRAKVKARVDKWRAKNKPETLRNVTERSETSHTVTERLVRVEDSYSNKEDSKEEKKERAAPKALSDLSAFKADLERDATPEQVEAFAKHRKAKNGQNSAYAATLFRRDATACRMSVSEAIDTALSRGWLTVKPEYLAGRQSTAPPQRMPPAETVGSLSKRQLFQGTNPDASNDTTGRVVQIDAGRLEGSTGPARSFALPSNILGRV